MFSRIKVILVLQLSSSKRWETSSGLRLCSQIMKKTRKQTASLLSLTRRRERGYRMKGWSEERRQRKKGSDVQEEAEGGEKGGRKHDFRDEEVKE